MDSLERMNDVIAYIEENIAGDIDYAHIARIACCPTHQFQRIFAFITDMTLADYIRRRRLSLAAQDLRQGRESILSVALRYGYDSHAAFTRAFRDQHGISPSQAREKGAVPRILPRMAFHVPLQVQQDLHYRIEKGIVKMARVSKLEFVPFGPYQIVGKELRTKPMSNNIATFWAQCFTDGTYDKLSEMKDCIPEELGGDYVGYITGFNETDGSFVYIVGMFMKAGTPAPQGYVSYPVPACTLARAWVEGEEFEIYANAHTLTIAAVREHGAEPDWRNFFECEVYTDERFGIPKNNGERTLILDYCMPVKA